MNARDKIDNSEDLYNLKVIYFGSNASIKNHLSKIFIDKIKLSDIFNQTYVGTKSQSKKSISIDLPNIIYSYSPVNIEQIVDSYNPSWVFIDCGEGTKVDWVLPLLKKLEEKRITGIACINNPLSNINEFFEKHNWNIFSWVLGIESSIKTEIYPYCIQNDFLRKYHTGYCLSFSSCP